MKPCPQKVEMPVKSEFREIISNHLWPSINVLCWEEYPITNWIHHLTNSWLSEWRANLAPQNKPIDWRARLIKVQGQNVSRELWERKKENLVLIKQTELGLGLAHTHGPYKTNWAWPWLSSHMGIGSLVTSFLRTALWQLFPSWALHCSDRGVRAQGFTVSYNVDSCFYSLKPLLSSRHCLYLGESGI